MSLGLSAVEGGSAKEEYLQLTDKLFSKVRRLTKKVGLQELDIIGDTYQSYILYVIIGVS